MFGLGWLAIEAAKQEAAIVRSLTHDQKVTLLRNGKAFLHCDPRSANSVDDYEERYPVFSLADAPQAVGHQVNRKSCMFFRGDRPRKPRSCDPFC